jgi:hypothetical protein
VRSRAVVCKLCLVYHAQSAYNNPHALFPILANR